MTASVTGKLTRRRRCSECGELKDEVLGKQRLCEKCEQDKTYCTVCDYWYSGYGGGCRHVQWAGCNCGCGTWDIEPKDHKESFMLLLEKLRPLTCLWETRSLLPELLSLIEADNFWTCWHGPLIGAPPALALKFEKDFGTHKGVLELCDISGSQQEDWGEEAIDALQLGMSWLTSLDSKTKDANKITAGWMREFASARNALMQEGA